jgi:uncharacterized protein YjbJ (UPF0337 family)
LPITHPVIERPPNAEELTMSDKTDQIKGRAKEAAGKLTDDKDLQHEGKVDRVAGETKEKLGDAKDKVEGAVDKVKDKLHR